MLVVKDQCRIKCGYFSRTIVIVRIVVMLLKLISHTSMKYYVNFDTNMIDSFDSNSELKFYPLLHIMASRYNAYITYGIRARVTILRPIWAQHENLKVRRC